MGLQPIPDCDTAGSAKAIAEMGDTTTGAIASIRAGKLYGLQIIQENLEDTGNNYTRFLVIQKTPVTVQTPSVLSGENWLNRRFLNNTLSTTNADMTHHSNISKTSIVFGFNGANSFTFIIYSFYVSARCRGWNRAGAHASARPHSHGYRPSRNGWTDCIQKTENLGRNKMHPRHRHQFHRQGI